MSSKRIERRSRMKPFVKFVNYNHLLPTRYMVATQDIDLKPVVTDDKLSTKESKKALKREIRKIFQDKYVTPYLIYLLNLF